MTPVMAGLCLSMALALTGCASADRVTAQTGHDVTPMAVEVRTFDGDGSRLRSDIQAALYDHVYLAGAAMNQALADGGDLTTPRTAAAVQALDDNSVAVAALIGSVYPDAEQPFLDSWRSHIVFFVDYTLAKATDDRVSAEKAVADLQAYAVSFGQLVNSVIPGMSAESVQAELETHGRSMLAAIDANVFGDPAYYGLLQRAAFDMRSTATVFSDGIAADQRLD